MKRENLSQHKIEKLVLKAQFQTDIKKERRQRQLPLDGIKFNKEAIETHALNTFSAIAFTPNQHQPLDSIGALLKKHDLDERYRDALKNYIYFNDFHASPFQNDSLVRCFTESVDKNNWQETKVRVFLEIYAETSIKDVQKIWTEKIAPYQKNAIGYREGRETIPANFSRDKRMYELRQIKTPYPEIKKMIKTEFNEIVMPFEMPNIIKRFKKKYIGK